MSFPTPQRKSRAQRSKVIPFRFSPYCIHHSHIHFLVSLIPTVLSGNSDYSRFQIWPAKLWSGSAQWSLTSATHTHVHANTHTRDTLYVKRLAIKAIRAISHSQSTYQQIFGTWLKTREPGGNQCEHIANTQGNSTQAVIWTQDVTRDPGAVRQQHHNATQQPRPV